MDLKQYLVSRAALVNRALHTYLPADKSLIVEAMRYSLLAGGKRLRPILVLAGAELCGGKAEQFLPAACALEYVHTYSLIHDDLPAMDNDDLRRGRPTSHKKFGEAAAILAGDALLTEAFRLMSLQGRGRRFDQSAVVESTGLLADAAGYKGMIGGQAKDTIESDSWSRKSRQAAIRNIEFIHLNKTAALLKASLVIGATLARGTKQQRKALDSYGRNIGLAFQVADDILDIVADKKLLGKKGSDRENNKLTYPALYGIERSRIIARQLVENAKRSLSPFGEHKTMLSLLADYIVERQY
jgi:geranylgeranyl diphosphate synthase type II